MYSLLAGILALLWCVATHSAQTIVGLRQRLAEKERELDDWISFARSDEGNAAPLVHGIEQLQQQLKQASVRVDAFLSIFTISA